IPVQAPAFIISNDYHRSGLAPGHRLDLAPVAAFTGSIRCIAALADYPLKPPPLGLPQQRKAVFEWFGRFSASAEEWTKRRQSKKTTEQITTASPTPLRLSRPGSYGCADSHFPATGVVTT